VARAGVPHRGHERAAALYGPAQVCREEEVPVLARHVQEGGRHRHSGVVDEQIDTGMLAPIVLRRLCERGPVGDVERVHPAPAAAGHDLAQRLLRGGRAQVLDSDGEPLPRQLQTEGAAEAGARSRYEGAAQRETAGEGGHGAR
jgi:hypothetical protein